MRSPASASSRSRGAAVAAGRPGTITPRHGVTRSAPAPSSAATAVSSRHWSTVSRPSGARTDRARGPGEPSGPAGPSTTPGTGAFVWSGAGTGCSGAGTYAAGIPAARSASAVPRRGQGVRGGKLTDPPGAAAARRGGDEERLGGDERGARDIRSADPHGRRVVADVQQRTAPGGGLRHTPPVLPARFCDQPHITAERRHISPAVVQDEEETAGERGRGRARAEQAVQLTGPQPHVRRGAAVQTRERGGQDVADAFVAFGGQQARVAQQLRELLAAVLREAAQFHVAAGGEGEVAVAQALRGVGQRRCLPGRQVACGQPDSRQAAVVGGVQPQRSRAGVTAVPWGRCGRSGPERGGGRHGGEHTDVGQAADRGRRAGGGARAGGPGGALPRPAQSPYYAGRWVG